MSNTEGGREGGKKWSKREGVCQTQHSVRLTTEGICVMPPSVWASLQLWSVRQVHSVEEGIRTCMHLYHQSHVVQRYHTQYIFNTLTEYKLPSL